MDQRKKLKLGTGKYLQVLQVYLRLVGYTDNLPEKSSYFFNGTLDDIRIYNRALSVH